MTSKLTELCEKVFRTKAGKELLDVLYADEVISKTCPSNHGLLAYAKGRSDLVIKLALASCVNLEARAIQRRLGKDATLVDNSSKTATHDDFFNKDED